MRASKIGKPRRRREVEPLPERRPEPVPDDPAPEREPEPAEPEKEPTPV